MASEPSSGFALALRQRSRLPVVLAGLLLTGLLAIRLWVMEPVAVESESMKPTLNPGSVVLVLRQGQAVRHVRSGDVVVFASPADGSPVIKRVVAEAGQEIEIRDAVLYVDSVPVQEPFVDYASIDGTYYPSTEVPEGTVFVLGDNRERSIDSRDFGPLPLEGIDGIVLGVP